MIIGREGRGGGVVYRLYEVFVGCKVLSAQLSGNWNFGNIGQRFCGMACIGLIGL